MTSKLIRHIKTGLTIAIVSPVFFYQITCAQQKTVILDSIFRKAILVDYPKISFTDDALTNQLYKKALKSYYLSNLAIKEKIQLSVEDSTQLMASNQCSSIKYLSLKYDSISTKNARAIDPKLITQTYEANRTKYTVDPIISYLHCTVNRGFEKDSVEIKQKFLAMILSGVDVNNFQKTVSEKQYINSEKSVSISPFISDFSLLHDCKKRDLITSRANQLSYYYIIDASIRKIKSQEEVADEIALMIEQSKIDEQQKQIDQILNSNFQVELYPAYFSYLENHKTIPSSFGKINQQEITSQFIAIVQSSFPNFHFSDSPDEFKNLIARYYSIPAIKAQLISNSVDKTDREVIAKIAELNYRNLLASIVEKKDIAQLSVVDSKEVLQYYQNNRSLYEIYGHCSFLKAQLIDTSYESIQSATADLKVALKQLTPDLKIKKENTYIITNEPDADFSPSNKLYSFIASTALNTVSELYKNGGRSMIILPYKKDDKTYKSVEIVNAEITQQIINARRESYAAKLKASTFSAYSFVFK